jgi:hypothetical protein
LRVKNVDEVSASCPRGASEPELKILDRADRAIFEAAKTAKPLEADEAASCS